MAIAPQVYKKGDTFRTSCRQGRIVYHPDWSPSMPWASYVRGTACLHFTNPNEAETYFMAKYGMKLVLTLET